MAAINLPPGEWTVVHEHVEALDAPQSLANARLFAAVRELQTLESTGDDLQDAIDELVAAVAERFPEFKETK